MKFCGKIGYVKTEETKPGVWSDFTIEKDIVGDYIRTSQRFVSSSGVNDDLKLSTSISIIADPYTMQNFSFIKYIRTIEGIRWKVETIDNSQYPRLILTLGGEYNA